MNSLVSIIITTKNEDKVLRKLLFSIKKQLYKDYEIILVDNNSKDNTCKIARRYANKILNFGPERSAQRNFGAKNSKGKYLFFLDADMELTKNVVKECVEVIENDKEIGGIVIPELSVAVKFWEKVKAFERSFYNETGDVHSDAIRFFPKEVFNRIGGFDETMTGPEDWDITDRIRKSRYGVGRINSRIYHHEKIPSLFSLMRKKYYYGLSAYKYLQKNKISALGPKTIYFFRPVFYRNLDKILTHPILSLWMSAMLLFELLAGGAGYFVGRIKR